MFDQAKQNYFSDPLKPIEKPTVQEYKSHHKPQYRRPFNRYDSKGGH